MSWWGIGQRSFVIDLQRNCIIERAVPQKSCKSNSIITNRLKMKWSRKISEEWIWQNGTYIITKVLKEITKLTEYLSLKKFPKIRSYYPTGLKTLVRDELKRIL